MRRPPRNVKISFTDKAQTHFGGLYFLQEFVRVLQLRDRLAHAVKDPRPRTRYSISQRLLAFIYPVILGLTRVEAAHVLAFDSIFQYVSGLPRFPNPSTLRRFLYQASPALTDQVRRFTDRLTARLLQRPHQRSRLLLDLDSTSLVVYGEQEGARRAYNPRRRGAKSYEPLICCEANSGLFWSGTLRPGGTVGAVEVLPFLEHTWAMFPPSVREVRVRADATFYSEDTLIWLEDRRVEYAIVARLTPPLKRRITSLRYRPVAAQWDVADTQYRATGWERSRRIVVVRKRLQVNDPQPTLFVLGRYAYHAFVTTLALQPEHVWHFYNARAALELLIKELKYDYGLGHIPTGRFNANSMYFQLLRLAYNLVVGFQTLCLPDDWHQATLATIRRHFLLLPAVLTRPQGRPTLRFSRYLPIQTDCKQLMKNLRSLQRKPVW